MGAYEGQELRRGAINRGSTGVVHVLWRGCEGLSGYWLWQQNSKEGVSFARGRVEEGERDLSHWSYIPILAGIFVARDDQETR